MVYEVAREIGWVWLPRRSEVRTGGIHESGWSIDGKQCLESADAKAYRDQIANERQTPSQVVWEGRLRTRSRIART